MMKKLLVFVLAISLVCLAACSAKKELPAPVELFLMIESEIDIPEMVDFAEELLESDTGISPEQYSSAVYCLSTEGNSVEEIIIIAAVDADTAKDIEEKLNIRFKKKAEAVKNYLTEYQPIVNRTAVRRDGLTVSLICCEKVDEILKLYDKL